MRVVVVGATGNAGTSLLTALAADPAVGSVVGVARRRPEARIGKVEWRAADITSSPLEPLFQDADAIVHLAWLIQPSHDEETMRRVNVDGSRRLFEAAAASGAGKLVYASSGGAYSPGPKGQTVDEFWPTRGIQSSYYSRHKAACEAMLDEIESRNPLMDVVRLRPALIFKRDAASGIRRLFAGPFLPNPLLHRSLIPVLPDLPGLRFQAVHSLDVGEAYRLAITRPVRGAFNIAAEPVLDGERLRRLLHARRIPMSARVARVATDLSWRLHLQPTSPGWLDMALETPIMDTTRARAELGWEPQYTAEEAFLELLEGMRNGDGFETPPLHPRTGGPFRIRELMTGVGERVGLR